MKIQINGICGKKFIIIRVIIRAFEITQREFFKTSYKYDRNLTKTHILY